MNSMLRGTLLVFALLLLSISLVSSAYSLSEVNSLLASYNVPGAIISSLQPVDLSYSGNHYLGMYNGSYPYFIVNLTGQYSLVVNTTAIYNIIKGYTLNVSLSKINFSALHKQMLLYERSGATPINDCLYETGLSSGATCTVANYCASCLSIPLCKCLLTSYGCPAGTTAPGGGTSGIFGKGIITFEGQYATMNSSFNSFLGATNSINSTNVLSSLARANAAFANITNLTHSIFLNPIFPPNSNVTPNQVAGCSSYTNQSIAPWYCSALGYCENVNYNYTRLAYISNLLANINKQPLSNTQIFSLAFNVSANESTYAYPILSKERLAALNKTLNKTVPGYGALVNASVSLLGHVVNVTLRNQLNALMSNYVNVTTNYFYANLSKANITLSTQYSAVQATYSSLNASYTDIVDGARNNTARVIELQLSSSSTSSAITDLALAQLALNSQISAGGLTNLSLLDKQVDALSVKAMQYSTSPLTFTEIARGTDSPFIRGLASTLGLSYAGAVGLAPLLGSILSLIIGIVIVVALFFMRSYLGLHHKLRTDRRTAQNWRRIFLGLGVIVFIYFIVTYSLLQGASASAPFSAFQSAYRSASYAVVAINGTPTISEVTCASKISAVAVAGNKTAVVAGFKNGICAVGNTTSTVDSCMNFYAKANIPVIVLTNSSSSSLGIYSLYGTVLRVSGNSTVMNDCYVSLLLNR
ncbi:MAG: hypothetical protein KGH57_04675 [Candidatus Micrarchaeota archaeon]|nr:hypothetical protein [Candidatus Micrarchaeota archaeon]